MNMQRLPLGQRRMGLKLDNHPCERLWRRIGKQPVATVNLLFFRITRDVKRDTLPGMGGFCWLVLCMQRTYTHRFIYTSQPE
ncbi:Uncharacterised protein [Shigella sonnei]|nr:Uncharacterised protein [Shigella sonnei]CSG28148.1 Uncharacterised protein [Shigella sonnei]